jgi:hypothetical protein
LKTSYSSTVPDKKIELTFIIATQSGPSDPNTFKQAWCHSENQEKWREAIEKDFKDMMRKGL